ncbi:sodium:proton antiporter [Microbacterium sp. EYE_5]|uniref:DUF6328 family protein n=1 Tax=unclassified Microbacterium TaxID=2609290 RepID=UPI002003D477|nr:MULTISPECIES: DUF6328 family protein [unclassified Microbacterium]MCK6081005.1 sodium:proton antiporter [Microbacterium sp. EYE_382]MCK6086275.1 sodium:proton antiporter [Microbacterium sp. EYE_384]MCK6124227.1 sodium:proton antiporter [Microbacterium sp. EYE_80]MCK6127136.1 sodium:proton antiporter [Microbacterium sp. EYE_79]MCK6141960.1 sodium:proton antiporter [Microbacterium sp. EYE_39]
MGTRTDDPTADAAADGRDETRNERADRNWSEVLQELRVLQTGTQILTGFLLALAFQPTFDDLGSHQRIVYLALIVLSALSAVVALAPVALHRILFAQRAKPTIVRFGHVCMIAALLLVSTLLVGVVAFVFDVVVGGAASWISGGALSLTIVVLWVAIPAAVRTRAGRNP